VDWRQYFGGAEYIQKGRLLSLLTLSQTYLANPSSDVGQYRRLARESGHHSHEVHIIPRPQLFLLLKLLPSPRKPCKPKTGRQALTEGQARHSLSFGS